MVKGLSLPGNFSGLCLSYRLGYFSFPNPSILFQHHLLPSLAQNPWKSLQKPLGSWFNRNQPCVAHKDGSGPWTVTYTIVAASSHTDTTFCSYTCASKSHFLRCSLTELKTLRYSLTKSAWSINKFGKLWILHLPHLYVSSEKSCRKETCSSFTKLLISGVFFI